MIRLVHHELAGRLGASWAMLVREHREVVARDLYVSCPPGPPIDELRAEVLGVEDEVTAIPVLGRIRTKAVQWRFVSRGEDGLESPTSTGHLIAQDGEWRWTLSRQSLAAFRAGNCP